MPSPHFWRACRSPGAVPAPLLSLSQSAISVDMATSPMAWAGDSGELDQVPHPADAPLVATWVDELLAVAPMIGEAQLMSRPRASVQSRSTFRRSSKCTTCPEFMAPCCIDHTRVYVLCVACRDQGQAAVTQAPCGCACIASFSGHATRGRCQRRRLP